MYHDVCLDQTGHGGVLLYPVFTHHIMFSGSSELELDQTRHGGVLLYLVFTHIMFSGSSELELIIFYCTIQHHGATNLSPFFTVLLVLIVF